MQTVVTILLTLLIITNLLPLVRHSAWWIRACDFPRYLLLGLLILFGVAQVLVGMPGGIGGVLLGIGITAAALYQLFTLTRYSRLRTVEVPSAAPDYDRSRSVSILVANVLMTNRDAEPLLKLVKRTQPDIVLLLEPDEWWGSKTEVLQSDYQWHIAELRDNLYGIQLFSRLELVAPRIDHILKQDIPSLNMQARLPCGELVRLYCLHPEPPSPTEADSSAPRDAELLICGKRIRDAQENCIVAGDLNDVAWSHSNNLFQAVSGLLDPRKGRGMFNTFNAFYPWLRWPLDHVFHSPKFKLVSMQRHEFIGSDHFPFQVELVLDPEGATAVEPPHLEREEAVEAEAAISEGVIKVQTENSQAPAEKANQSPKN